MKIIADENITHVEAFQHLGELRTLAGRKIDAAVVKDADALLVRSITQVDRSLLENSSLKFIASATSGIDHIDLAYLKQRNITFCYAPGCNANSVVEYVFSALACLATQTEGFDWRKRSFGIIGAGNIGGLLAERLRALGIPYLIYDPFLDSSSQHGDCLASFEEVLGQDVLSIHTPLTKTGQYPSYHLFNAHIIAELKPGTVLINAARGGVVDNQALLARLQVRHDLLCVLDAWEGEPEINLALLKQVNIGTAHIAGYSRDGKLNGTRVLFDALSKFFSLPAESPFDSGQGVSLLALDESLALTTELEKLNACLLAGYDIRQDHGAIQTLLQASEPAAGFDLLRKHYRVRQEFCHWGVESRVLGGELDRWLMVLGFRNYSELMPNTVTSPACMLPKI